jgi:hypothetical protein
MNKYQLGQTLYWIKYAGGKPELITFEVGNIKQSIIKGYAYSHDKPAALYVTEEHVFDSIQGAVDNACRMIKGFLNERS